MHALMSIASAVHSDLTSGSLTLTISSHFRISPFNYLIYTMHYIAVSVAHWFHHDLLYYWDFIKDKE
jgi:hypothetical protein